MLVNQCWILVYHVSMFFFFLMIRRPPRSTQSRSSAASDVYKRQVPIVAITDSGFSPLAPLSEAWFEVAEANFEGFRSMAATLSLAMTLTVAVAEMRGRRN